MSEREGQCVRCGGCCVNPSVSVELTEDLAHFYSNFGVEVFKIGEKFKGRFRLGTICKHFTRLEDGKGSCDIYENRPNICKTYPLKDSGLHRDCGYK